MPATVTGHLTPGEFVADLTVEELPGLARTSVRSPCAPRWRDWRQTELTLSLDGGGLLAGVRNRSEGGFRRHLHAAIQPTRLDRLLPELSGSLTAELEAGSFDWDAARLAATIALQEVGYRGWSTGDIDTDLSFDAGATRVLLRGQGLRADVRLEGTGRFSATARLDSEPPPAATPVLRQAGSPPALRGYVRQRRDRAAGATVRGSCSWSRSSCLFHEQVVSGN